MCCCLFVSVSVSLCIYIYHLSFFKKFQNSKYSFHRWSFFHLFKTLWKLINLETCSISTYNPVIGFFSMGKCHCFSSECHWFFRNLSTTKNAGIFCIWAGDNSYALGQSWVRTARNQSTYNIFVQLRVGDLRQRYYSVPYYTWGYKSCNFKCWWCYYT